MIIIRMYIALRLKRI